MEEKKTYSKEERDLRVEIYKASVGVASKVNIEKGTLLALCERTYQWVVGEAPVKPIEINPGQGSQAET